MKKYHINFAHGRYKRSQEYCSESARRIGFDVVRSYIIDDIDPDFMNKNSNLFNQPRGFGYWIWKSYLISKTLLDMDDGDLLVYSDSGSYYNTSIPEFSKLIDIILSDKHGVLSFELKGLMENEYTKRDAFVLMGLDEPKYTETSQREATYIWLIKNEFTIGLINEYKEYSQNINIISDMKNVSGDNYPQFKDHRHDQSIWSLLCKKYDIEPHRLISQHGNHLVGDFPNDTYGQITIHHRNPM